MQKNIPINTIKEEIVNFLIDRQSRNLSKRTIEFYRDILTAFSVYSEKAEITAVSDITANLIRQYILLLSETHNPGGVHCHFRCIRSFLNWFELETDQVFPNPIRKVIPPKVSHNPIPGVPIADVSAMLITCKNDFLGLRDQAILRALIDTGARAAEFCNLRIMDISMDTGTVKIIGGKGNKDRVVFITPTTRRDIMRYLRKRTSKNARDWLWVTRSNTQLGKHGLVQVLIRRARAANVEVPSPHDFRRTFALECLRNGMGLIQLMYLMGHTTTTVLQRYLALQENDLRKVFEEKGPDW